MKKDTFYITTPIYYPSGKWHVGTCYTTVVCDSIARFYRMLGRDVFFLTGTDEHGQKIADKAKAAGREVKEYVDDIVDDLKSIWTALDISYDHFIRTTDASHIKAVQKIFKKLYENGDIYKSRYSGSYCTPCESFWTESQLKDGKCPDCGREVHVEEEESYFFKLSKYADRILKLYTDNPEFLQPKSRVNEMVNNFIKPGLQDLCVSRTSVKWGIPVDFDSKHVVYVWVDALSNYISALGYGSDDESLFNKFWPADIHMTAKEIIRFHAIIWPALLMALDLPLPKQVYGHGWLLLGGDKLSKSKSDKIKYELTDPKQVIARYGSDALRYFLLREIPFGNDGVYTNESLLSRINSDLANDLGNLVSRTTAMINQYFGGKLPKSGEREAVDLELIKTAEGVFPAAVQAIRDINASKAVTEIFKLISRANKYIDETTPWLLAKEESKKERLATVLYNLAESLRIAAIMLKPFLPKTAPIILNSIGVDADNENSLFKAEKFGGLPCGVTVTKAVPMFPRIDIPKELIEIEKLFTDKKGEAKAEAKDNSAVKNEDKPIKQAPKKAMVDKPEEITIDEFFKTELRVALVEECEAVEKSDKLLKLSLSLGKEKRTVVSGIKEFYAPEDLVGKRVILVANLKPCKLRGILSQGMILCAEDSKGKVSIVQPGADVEEGSRVR